MAQIPPAAWIGVGLTISAVAVVLEDLIIFVVPGVAFILWGAGKAVLGNTDKGPAPQHTYNTKPKQPDRPIQQAKIARCYVCNAKNSSQANYCGHCGHKLP